MQIINSVSQHGKPYRKAALILLLVILVLSDTIVTPNNNLTHQGYGNGW